MAGCFPKKSSWSRNDYVCNALSGPTHWILRSIKNMLLFMASAPLGSEQPQCGWSHDISLKSNENPIVKVVQLPPCFAKINQPIVAPPAGENTNYGSVFHFKLINSQQKQFSCHTPHYREDTTCNFVYEFAKL